MFLVNSDNKKNSEGGKRVRRWLVSLIITPLRLLLMFVIAFSIGALVEKSMKGDAYATKRIINALYGNYIVHLVTPADPITYTITIAADEELIAAHPDWEEKMKSSIQAASSTFLNNFGIQFAVSDVVTWDSDDSINDLDNILKETMRDVNPGNGDIVVSWTGQDVKPIFHFYIHQGAAIFKGRHLIVRTPEAVLHEIGHLFGAEDYPPDHANARIPSTYATLNDRYIFTIDDENKARIRDSKYKLIW
jgi:Metallo-peptidase family M12